MLSSSLLEAAIHVSFLLSTMIPIAVATPPTTDPQWQLDAIPPYPSLTNITTANTLGTRLFGWVGCSVEESQMIAEAYDDFYKLAQQDGVYQNIAWDEEAAIEFFGPSRGVYAVSDTRRAEIQRKLNSELTRFPKHILICYRDISGCSASVFNLVGSTPKLMDTGMSRTFCL
jgi:hypothetical protein